LAAVSSKSVELVALARVLSLKLVAKLICHPERVKMILENTDSNEHNLIELCCVGIVQGNCANFVNLAATGPLGTRSRGAAPLLPKVNLGQYAMSVPAVHTVNDK
jgi:hypothetical protein